MRVAFWCSLLAVAGCDCASTVHVGSDQGADGGPGECSDVDGDGYGAGAGCRGPDCNDSNPDIHAEDQCDPYCEQMGNLATGCPCDALEPQTCYFGPDGTRGVGRCAAGNMFCEGGVWGSCDGQILPRDEQCDEMDDDCDGETDEGVLSECGTCDECNRDCAGPDCGGWGEGAGPGVVETADGSLTLDAEAVALHVLWPSSSGTGEVYRMDTETLAIEGAYWTGPNHGSGNGFDGDSPSRSAVDDLGSLIIANRAWGIEGSITKIASDESLCVDRNGDGRIDTSTAWDDKLAFDAHDDWDDECILWHTVVGEDDAIPRGIAIHQEYGLDGVLEERGWVGLYNAHRFEQFDTATGELTDVVAPTPDFTPYGAQIDREGWVWAPGLLDARVGRFDTADPDDSFEILTMPDGALGFRVIVDENGTPWFSGNGLWRFDRDTEEFDRVTITDCGEVPGDIIGYMVGWVGSIASDGDGSVFVASYRECMYRVTNDPGGADDLVSRTIPTPGVLTFGAAVDFDGHAWGFDHWGGSAVTIDVETEAVDEVLDDCAGGSCLSLPYVRGDITGMQRRNALKTAVGPWSTVFEGCEAGETDWTSVEIDGLTPAGTSLAVSARTGASLAEVAAAPWTTIGVVPTDGTDLDVDAAFVEAGIDDARYLEVRVVLQSIDGVTAPTLREVAVEWGCEPIVG